MESTLTILKKLTDGYMEQERQLEHKYPWAEIIYNWTLFVAAVWLVISLFCWGVDIHITRRAEEQTAAFTAAYEAEQKAAAEAKAMELAAQQKSEEAIMEREATEIAKAFYGIRNFVDKYHYTADDLKTYARCVFNRVDAGVNSLEAVIGQKDQFLGYAETNPVLQEFYDVAIEAVEEWHSETVKPCDSSYRFAELKDRGIFLVNEYGADGYVQRWHA